MTLARVLACPRHHGLTLNDLAHASGLDQPFVARLLAELCAG
jgi:DNA-binding IclR family transcriptional regulator